MTNLPMADNYPTSLIIPRPRPIVPPHSIIPRIQSSHERSGYRFIHERTPAHTYMAHTYPSSSSSPNFQLIFNNALKLYEKRTKNDLLAHPLAAQLQACQSPSNILSILQQQLQHLHQSRDADDRWTKWLDPTVNVLYAFSATLGEGVGLVRLRT